MKQFTMKNSLLMMSFILCYFWTFGQRNESPVSVAVYPLDMFMDSDKILSDNIRPVIANGYHSTFRVSRGEEEPIWRPLKYRFYLGTTNTSYGDLNFNTDGSLHSIKAYRIDGNLFYIAEYNNTYTQ